ncbi:MAG: hypothetical protein Q4B62_04045 [Clostridiaceae bacterium]|nr:hypothetical protein [Clostridiaceae bacterium]
MVINCNVPSLNGLDDSTKIKKMEKYLWELNDQLRFILSNLEIDNFTIEAQDELQISAQAKEKTEHEMKQTLDSMKQKIINTAESISSDIQMLRETMEGHYAAVSNQFGTYTADYFRETTKSALATLDEFKQIENINGYYLESKGYIKTGNIGTRDDGSIIFGIEIGDVQDPSGTKLRLSNNTIRIIESGTEVAHIEGGEMKISRVIVDDYIYLGGYRVTVTDGIEFKWEGSL